MAGGKDILPAPDSQDKHSAKLRIPDATNQTESTKERQSYLVSVFLPLLNSLSQDDRLNFEADVVSAGAPGTDVGDISEVFLILVRQMDVSGLTKLAEELQRTYTPDQELADA